MFANMRSVGREFRITPSHVETMAGRASAPPKSLLLATRTPRSKRSGSVRADGKTICRDDLARIIQKMFTPEKETARSDQEQAADEAIEAGNLKNDGIAPTNKLIAEARQISRSIPFMLTRERKRAEGSRVCTLWLQIMAEKRCNHDART